MCSTLLYLGLSQHFSNKQKLEPTWGKWLHMRTYCKFDDSQVAIYVSCLKWMDRMGRTLTFTFYRIPSFHGNPFFPCHPKTILRGETWGLRFVGTTNIFCTLSYIVERHHWYHTQKWNWFKGLMAMAPDETILEVVKMQEPLNHSFKIDCLSSLMFIDLDLYQNCTDLLSQESVVSYGGIRC